MRKNPPRPTAAARSRNHLFSLCRMAAYRRLAEMHPVIFERLVNEERQALGLPPIRRRGKANA